MFKVYNSRTLAKNQRFIKGLLYGGAASLVLAVAYGFLSNLIRIEFSVVYLGIGYAIGMVIQKYGRGVKPEFSVLGAVLAFVCFFLGDMISMFGFNIFTSFDFFFLSIRYTFMVWTNLSANALLGLAFRVAGIYLAYQNARIV